MVVIDVENITKKYGDTTAVKDLSFEVEKGELFALLGPNGAGKTTIINILTGQKTPDSGSVSVLGESPITDPVTVRNNVGILPEKQEPTTYLTVKGEFEYIGEARGLTEDYIAERMNFWVDFLDLEDHLHTYNGDLSRGQKQKVMIAKAFFHEPSLVFIDEPLSNLDPIAQERLKNYFARYVEEGNTLFLSTHHIEIAEELATSIAVIENGDITTVQKAEDIKQESLIDLFIDEVSIEV